MATIVILGGGESGWGTALLAKKQGHTVFLSDSGTLAYTYREALEKEGIDYEEGGHDEVYRIDPTEVVKSPGIAESAPVAAHFIRQGIPVISEIEFAGRYSTGRTICITGSNGKTTTATLTYQILKEAGYDVALSGNIGDSYAAQVATGDRQWYVLELSSFQLDGMYSFRADTAVLLNITPDHLNRYGYDMDKYAASKMRIAANQTSEDFFIYNGHDAIITHRPELTRSKAGKLPFSIYHDGRETWDKEYIMGTPLEGGAYFQEGCINVFVPGHNFSMAAGEIGIKGRHNIANAMAAALAAMAAGVDTETVKSVLHRFRGVEHRMEEAGTVKGIRFINDSKATNTDAAWYALDGTEGPIVWIAGGTDKGNDYRELAEIARSRVKTLVCMGADNTKLMDNFAGVIPRIYDTHSLEDAMRAATECARAGDTVLLSPACASFDLFRNYEQRGRSFKEWVEEFKKRKER